MSTACKDSYSAFDMSAKLESNANVLFDGEFFEAMAHLVIALFGEAFFNVAFFGGALFGGAFLTGLFFG